MQTHGVSDADVTKRQLGWYLRNCAESAFAEDIKHLLGLLTGDVESGDGHDLSAHGNGPTYAHRD